MNREIKFRAWDKSGKKWIGEDGYSILAITFDGSAVRCNTDSCESPVSYFDSVEIMQFTGLWWVWLELIKRYKPQIIIGENVTAIRSKGLDRILHSLAEIGYDAEWCDLSASEFGAPHPRARTWVVAYPHGFGRGEESIIFSQIVGRPIPQAPEWEPSRAICSTYRKKTLPETYGIHDGLPRKLDKGGLDPEIKAYGNAIAPPVARAIFRAIKEVLL
ncbi:YopX family protein [Rufibacter quisquiliarum]|uniref:Site-specific DNA-cytosine methylase n=1 Tax=Rufibacter quisquiliarum TaxID=1549639 RepID=A0A839GU32_9BACT|nr:YopX family protein [Rufibacter quisquiliarum]MBA9078306.1 site-specific DNA-cytosine methylase [Rufibacter quisquiliarum]